MQFSRLIVIQNLTFLEYSVKKIVVYILMGIPLEVDSDGIHI